ncbi:MAG: PQQ-binding-like beta-propeller repeat protein [Gemmataceae bacterium]
MTRTLLALAAATLVAADWAEFRGPGGRGISPEVGLPAEWSPTENVAWKIDLPGRGLSAPAVVGRKLFLTSNSGMAQHRLHALAYDALTGKKLWERQFSTTGQTLCHPKTCMAAPTPVAGGGLVYFLFATNDLVATDTDGNVAWVRSLALDYPLATNHVGRAASPVLYKDVLIVPNENQGTSLLLGLDAKSGATRWSVERPLENNWTTPVIAEFSGKPAVLVQATKSLAAYDPITGKSLWSVEYDGLTTIPSPVVADGLVITAGQGAVALRPKADGPPEEVWKSSKLSSGTASPVVYDGKVYSLRRDVLVCCSLADGKVIEEVRVKGPFSASPVAADGKLYLVSEEGIATIVKLGGAKPELLGTGDLKLKSGGEGAEQDKALATPAVAGGSIYLRTDKSLYCLRAAGKRS